MLNHVVHRYRFQYLELRRIEMRGGCPEYPILRYYPLPIMLMNLVLLLEYRAGAFTYLYEYCNTDIK